MSPRLEARLRAARFIVDSMLGSLARWLRMIGCDTVYAKGWHDSRIIEEAGNSRRIIVTRDRGLFNRARRRGLDAVLVSDDVARALAVLSLRYGIPLEIVPERSRCPVCNSPLRSASKEEVKGRVPPRVYEAYDEFWVCTGCSQVYWRGGHWRGIEETLREARQWAEKLRSKRRR